MSPKLGIGVIGLSMGRNMLYVNHHTNMHSQVRAVCDLNPERLQDCRDEFSVPFATNDWREMVLRPDVDVVSIFAPDHQHMEMIRLALENGKHVICTKPMVVSLEEAKETVSLVRKHQRVFLVGQTRRFDKHHQEVKAFYDSGKIGRAMFAEASYVHGDMWKVFDRGAWRYEHPQDIIYGGACHPIDHLRWYFGDVDEVHAFGCTSPVDLRYPQNKEMNFIINLKFKNGVMARVLTACGLHEQPGGSISDIMPMEGVSIFGTHGTIVNYHAAYREGGDHDAPRQEVHFTMGDVLEDFDGKEYSGHLMSVLKYVQEVEDCILNHKQATVNEVVGAKCIAVCAACWESIKTGQTVKVFNEF
jgi:predicted dehydrogenase